MNINFFLTLRILNNFPYDNTGLQDLAFHTV